MKKLFIIWFSILMGLFVVGCDMFTRDVYDLIGEWELSTKGYETLTYSNEVLVSSNYTTNQINRTNGTYSYEIKELGECTVTYYSNNVVTSTHETTWAADEIRDHLTIYGDGTNITYMYEWTAYSMKMIGMIYRLSNTNITKIPVILSNITNISGSVTNEIRYRYIFMEFYKEGYTNTNVNSTNDSGGLF